MEIDRNINPPIEQEEFNHLFGYVGKINTKYGNIYVDLSGKFPLRYINGMTTVLFYITLLPILFYPLLSPMQKMKQW